MSNGLEISTPAATLAPHDEESKNVPFSPKDDSKPSTEKLGDRLRMWSAVSFAVMLIVVGVPLWWKTTEVYRAALPYEAISLLDPKRLVIAVNISVYTEYPTRTNLVIRELQYHLAHLELYKISVKPYKILTEDDEDVTIELIESNSSLHPKIPGQLLLVQVRNLPPGSHQLIVSNHRIIYFLQDTDVELLRRVIVEWLLTEKELGESVLSIVDPQQSKEDISHHQDDGGHGADGSERVQRRRLRASEGYDVIFTVVNSDPDNIHLEWDVQSAIASYVEPLLQQISEVGDHSAKSQWLYLVDLVESSGGRVNNNPTPSNTGTVLHQSQLPHIITPLEKKLGSGVSSKPCVHMILYTASCSVAPLSLGSPGGVGMVSPEWGAVQVINPTTAHCTKTANSTRRALVPSSHKVMAVFVSQFHELLGITHSSNLINKCMELAIITPIDIFFYIICCICLAKKELELSAGLLKNREGSLLRSWELDLLYRMRTVEQITLASLTLQSLSKLLGEISNIVINEEVAECVITAVRSVEEAVEQLKYGKIKEALSLARQAHTTAEKAFGNPSLLALLYFPDDQKYAVYIPLFLPIMIPVLMSLKNIYYWMKPSLPNLKLD